MEVAITEEIEQKLNQKLEQIAQRHRALEAMLSDAEVIKDSARYLEIVREHGGTVKFADAWREFEELAKRRVEAEELLGDGKSDKDVLELAHQEISECDARRRELYRDVLEMFLSGEDEADRSVIVEIRAGTGGDEAALFAGDLFRMYCRYADKKSWQLEELSSSVSEMGGFKEIIFSLNGPGVWQKIRYESGGHRVQRVPVTESQGRIHTSLATVAVLTEARDVEVELNPDDLEISFMRSSGPGGQHVNKTSSCVRIVHKPTGISVRCQDEKSQHRNRQKAMKILRARLYDRKMGQRREERQALRRSKIGSGDRNERIRTYNFPQDRITDHRIGLDLFGINNMLMGNCDELLDALAEHDKQDRIKSFLEN